jgi:phosphotransferase system IIB component
VVNRKGTGIVIIVCTKSTQIYNEMKEIMDVVKNIY